eukprot:CAMPEP_0184208714 /NCGR_PEP_ID=MMETSP0976-20121227/11745_1 /TAXON_ID=483370 /ORGANISM="non described non described, Strain CCMP2097" /LENGTH=75 /DNA_ID=CAMNT_0026513373 /DNA_START=58 /DNA_END=281 /DNA_ORIENTATION=+
MGSWHRAAGLEASGTAPPRRVASRHREGPRGARRIGARVQSSESTGTTLECGVPEPRRPVLARRRDALAVGRERA